MEGRKSPPRIEATDDLLATLFSPRRTPLKFFLWRGGYYSTAVMSASVCRRILRMPTPYRPRPRPHYSSRHSQSYSSPVIERSSSSLTGKTSVLHFRLSLRAFVKSTVTFTRLVSGDPAACTRRRPAPDFLPCLRSRPLFSAHIVLVDIVTWIAKRRGSAFASPPPPCSFSTFALFHTTIPFSLVLVDLWACTL